MKSTKKLTRALSLLLLLTMIVSVLSGAIVAQAEEDGETPKTTPDDVVLIDTDVVGSITVHKYVSSTAGTVTDSSATSVPTTVPDGTEYPSHSASDSNATGTSGDATKVENDGSFSTLQGAKFILVKVADADEVVSYYDGKSAGTLPSITSLVVTGTDTLTVKYGENELTKGEDYWEGTTGKNGVYSFTGLAVGFYILKEVSYPANINGTCETTLISLPMVNTATSSNNDNAKWMYSIDVFPKNLTKKSSVTVEKVKTDGNALEGNLYFKLYRQDIPQDKVLQNGADNWSEIKAGDAYQTETTDGTTVEKGYLMTNGSLTIAGLEAGPYGAVYKLVEQSAPDGYIVDQDPIYFHIDKNRQIQWGLPTGDDAVTGISASTNNGTRFSGTYGYPTASDSSLYKITNDLVNLTFKLRNELPTVEKTVQDNPHSGTSSDTLNFTNAAEYEIDEVITYQIQVYIPRNFAAMPADHFVIQDIPDVGITDDSTKDNFTVTYEKEAAESTTSETVTVTQFTVTPISYAAETETTPELEAHGAGFKLTFASDIRSDIAGKTVTIQYKAKLNKNAVIAKAGNDNNVTLIYDVIVGSDVNANTPTGDDIPTYTLDDSARVYTYLLQLTKYLNSTNLAEGGDGELAQGVVFQLLKTKNGSAVDVVAVDADKGIYRIAAADDDADVKIQNMTTAEDGTITIQGVENTNSSNCKYFLKEIQTVANYNLLSEPYEVDIEITVPTGDAGFADDDAATDKNDIINKKGFVLPQTGSMGYLIFCAAGLLLIGGGAALIFGGRKKVIR